MKSAMILSAFLLASIAPDVMAVSCSDAYTRLSNPGEIRGALSEKRILAKAPSGEEWNEDHCRITGQGPGALYKVGTTESPPKYPGAPSVDPRAYRGTWEITGTGNNRKVKYSYTVGGSSAFEWTLWQNNSTGGLCWESDTGALIATAPAPSNIPGGLPCNTP